MKLAQLLELEQSVELDGYLNLLYGFAGGEDFGMVSAQLRSVDAFDRTLGLVLAHRIPASLEALAGDPAAARRDPVFVRKQRQSLPIAHDQGFYVNHAAGEAWEVLAAHGFKTGITVVVPVSPSKRFSLCFAGDRALPDNQQLLPLLAKVQMVAVYAHAAAERFWALKYPPTQAAVVPKLTPREREVLQWTMGGKTSWEIGQILAMSEHTVNFHVKNSMRKLAAVNRRDAVVKGIALGIL
jgi:DNA-binding CsgD family transcriptional regulator